MQVDVRVLGHHVVDPVGHQLALACGTDIMVAGFDGLGGEGRTGPGKIPSSFFLFRVDRHARIARRLIHAP